MIILDTPQGSLDWITERLWRLTGSQLKKNITTTGKLSASQAALENIDRLIAGIDAANEIRTNPDAIAGLDDWQAQEWIGHYTGEKFTGNAHTRRGNDLEPDALAALQERIGMQIDQVGMCIMGDNPNGVVSCSPDGLIYQDGKLVAGAEVKCPTLATFYGYVADGRLPDEYKLDETTCGACLNEQEFVKQIEAKILEHRRHAFDPETGEYHKAEIVRLKEHPMLKAAYNQRQEALSQKSSEALLRRWQ